MCYTTFAAGLFFAFLTAVVSDRPDLIEWTRFSVSLIYLYMYVDYTFFSGEVINAS